VQSAFAKVTADEGRKGAKAQRRNGATAQSDYAEATADKGRKGIK